MSANPAYTVTARNTATESENKIHDDAVAAAYGFAGGLVPGVDVYAYLTHVPAERWGLAWLARGAMTARFAHPVYDGGDVDVFATDGDRGSIELELRDGTGASCASGVAALGPQAGPDVDVDIDIDIEIDRADLPPERPPASPETLAPGTVLGTVADRFSADAAAGYLADVGERAPLYRHERVAHPGWLLRFANRVLVANVRLGPWIHVGSDVRFLDVVHDGDHVEARARVVGEHERKGHRFVVLDVALSADGRPVQRVRHTAIYQPRRGGS